MEGTFYYNTQVEWKDGRTGNLSSSGFPDINVATPPEFMGVHGIWTPEHLFVSSVNICLMTTFLAIAENSHLHFSKYSCEGRGKLEKVDGKFMISEIELFPKITVKKEKDLDRALRIIEKSENACLISNSIKTNVILKPEIFVNNQDNLTEDLDA